ncbi:helix-turn-helix transcriptional regulator [uncultured Pseudodesulfovibrio sp.]|uniref:helix-turn-helix transcriptional regulator n=1 Tax=uncultured Pseudodesulfovibrio sp. TaxID=2035858 RepID=UPI003749FFE5
MPPKKDPFSSPSQKVISLYSLLMFTGREYSLGQLSREMHCSKQTVIRMIEQISRSLGGDVVSRLGGGEKYYRMASPKVSPKVGLCPEEIQQLELCRGMVLHLLPEGVREQVRHTIAKTTALLPDMNGRERAFASVVDARIKGRIDYNPHQEHIASLIQAIQDKIVCEVTYHSPSNPKAKTYAFAPMKIISYHEALYVAGWRVEDEGEPIPRHSIKLAVHRLKKVIRQKRGFDIEMDPGQRAELFGFMKLDELKVKVKFDKETASYIKERQWSDDQSIREFKNGNLVLEFNAQSMPEVVSWILSFGAHAKVMEPKVLKDQLRSEVEALGALYL